MGFSRPPFHVPPKELALWVPEDERDYKSWKSRTGNKSASTEDFRNYIIDLNKEFDMEETFENLEIGLHSFRKLANFCSKFPKYSLMEDLERMYVEKDNVIVKDFIMFGDTFLRTHHQTVEEKLTVENSYSEPDVKSYFSAKSEGMEEDDANHIVKEELEVIGTPLTSNVDYLSQVLENDVEKSQFNSDTTVVETNQVDSCMALKDTTMDDLSQVTRLDTITPHTTTPSEKEDKEDKPKHRRKKERRKKRLLKFHEKLVKTSGLPPSRLMEREMLIGKNLESDFEQLAGGGAEFAHGPFPDTRSVPETGTSSPPVPPPMMPAALMPGQTCGVQPHTPAAPPGCGQPLGLMVGTTSGSNLHSPIHQSFNGTTSGTVRWFEARPMEGSSGNGNTFPTPGPVNWSTSGSLNLPALSLFSPPSAWSAILPPYQPKPQPVPQVVTPAYCFHCMQYGAVFTIIPA